MVFNNSIKERVKILTSHSPSNLTKMKNQLIPFRNNHRLFCSGRLLTGLAVTLIGFAIPASAQSVWNGGSATSSNWSDGANWGGTAIVSGNSATFSGTARRTNINDITSLTLPSVAFTTGGWNISGSPVTISGFITNNVAGTSIWGLNTVLTSGATVGNYYANAAGDTVNFTGVLSGSGGIGPVVGANGVGAIYLSSTNNSFTGQVGARSGRVYFYSLAPAGQNSSLGAGTSPINIGSSGTSYVGSMTYLGTNSGTTDRGVIFGNNTTGSPALTNSSPNNSSLTFGGNVSLVDGGVNVFATILAGSSTGTNTFNGIIGPTNGTSTWGGSFSVYGPGTWVFNNQVNVTGALNIFTNAHFVLGFTNSLFYSSTLFPTITVNSGATLDVSAYDNNGSIFTLGEISGFSQALTAGHVSGLLVDINGSLSMAGAAASTLTVAGSNVAGTLAINGNFIPANGVINIDLNTNNTVGSDLITVAGNLDLSQGTTTVNLKAFRGKVTAGVPYTLFAYTGNLIGDASGLNVKPPSFLYTVASLDTSISGLVTVTFASSGAANINLLWRGDISGDWDTTTANWFDGTNAVDFSTANSVIFDDSSSQTTVNLVGQISANNVTVSNNANAYTFSSSGGGGLADAVLLKQGSGSLLITSANTFGEGTVISAGSIQVGNVTALGSSGAVLGDANTGTNSATLGFQSGLTVAIPVTVASGGTGPAVIANLGSSASATENGAIVLQRGLTFSNANNAFNTFMIQGGITGTGDVTVLGGGGVKLQTGACSFTGNIYVLPGTSGTTLCNINAALSGNTSINLAAGTQLGIVNSAPFNALIGGGNVIAGPGAAYATTLTIGTGNGSGTFSGIITTNSGGWTPSVVKNGTGTEIFTGDFTGATSGSSTNTGGTAINAGTLAINNTTGTGLNPFGVAVAVAGTLAGTGFINENTNGITLAGKLSVGNAGDTTGKSFTIVGTGTTGALRINAGGSLMVDLFSGAGGGDNTANTNAADFLNAQTQVVITNASLVVGNPNAMSSWAIGDQWKIVNWGATVSGVFTNLNLPALPSGLAWDTSALYSTGVIGVVAPVLPTAPASITGITVSGTNLVLTGTNLNGGAGFHYVVLTTTNLATPLANWTILSTNSFNADGSFSFTNGLNPAQPALFFSTKAVQ
jgi:fibronectin-binding autotransporter adhesin